MFAAVDDFRGVGLVTYDQERLAEFFTVLGSEEISERLMAAIENTIELGSQPNSFCPLPCAGNESGGVLGTRTEARFSVSEDLLIIGVLQELDF